MSDQFIGANCDISESFSQKLIGCTVRCGAPIHTILYELK